MRPSQGLWREEAAELMTGKASRVVQIVPFTGTSTEPAFPQAPPLDELLDVKDDFKAALTRYRAAVGELEKLLEADIGAADLDAELDEIWSDRVEPTVLALEERFLEHSFVRELAKSGATSVRCLVTQGAALYIALSTVGELATHISAAAAAAGAALQVTGAAAAQRISAQHALTKED